MRPEVYSDQSDLTRLFAHRAGKANDGAKEAMLDLISRLRGTTRSKLGQISLDQYLAARYVVDIEYRRDLGFDGQVEPLGLTCQDGFRIVLDRSVQATRSRFSLAHEICHTFFYEYVPEIKFSPHPTDLAEERLCNFGAAELLMPAKLVKKATKGLPICLDSLHQLSMLFCVSTEAMVLRISALNLWKVGFASWIRLTNGKFAIERIIGTKAKDWEWLDSSAIQEAWDSGKSSAGRGILQRFDRRGDRQVLPVRYDLARRRDRVVVLWGKGVVGSSKADHPLFRAGSI